MAALSDILVMSIILCKFWLHFWCSHADKLPLLGHLFAIDLFMTVLISGYGGNILYCVRICNM